MDRRTLIFLIFFGLVFFGVNLFFSYWRDQDERKYQTQVQATREKENLAKSKEIEEKTARIEQLPLVDLYLDAQGKQKVAQGLEVGGGVLSLAWQKELPTTIYRKKNGGFEENFLKTKEFSVGGPILYAPTHFKRLHLAGIPEVGLYDLQLVTFPKGEPPRVYWGIFQDGTLSIPQGPLTTNALAIYKSNGEYFPLGFYESSGDVFVELQNLPLFTPIVDLPARTAALPSGEQKYYVLENDYQQLVFTNVGGALAEVNLPFHTEKDKESVVNEIGFDRDILEQNPRNATFPLYPYYIPGSEQEQQGKQGGYYPLIRRDLIRKDEQHTTYIPPALYALNIVSDYPELAELVFEVKEFTPQKIVFEASQPHRKITKTFSLIQEAPYIVDLKIDIEGDNRGLWLTSGIPEVEIMSRNYTPQIQYRITRKGKSGVEKLSLPKPGEVINATSVSPDWVVDSNAYLGIILDPLDENAAGYRATAIPGDEVPTRLSLIDPQYEPYKPSKYPGYEVLLPLPRTNKTHHFRIYAGPFEEDILKKVDRFYADPTTGYNPDYLASKTFYGWFSFISAPFAKFLYVVMQFFHRLTGSWGFSIILLTVFLRILLYPLNAWSIKSMKRMQLITPQAQEIQKKYKKDPKKAQMELMKLYREKKVNPFMGCLPILIQIPFLIGMFDLLKSSFQLRGASFISGWIDNLTAPDVLFSWDRPIFFIGNQFHLLPILLGVVMFFQQRMSTGGAKDISEMTDQQRQQRAMGNIMTVVFTVLFYHFPSGLNIYWLSSMLLGMLQQWYTNKKTDSNNTAKKLEAKKVKSYTRSEK